MRVHGVPVEFLTWNVVATGASPAWQEPEVPKPTGTVAKKREVFDLDAGTYVLSTEFSRDALAPLAWHPGPVVISEPQTTTLVPKGWRVQLAREGHLVLENESTANSVLST